MHIRAIFAAQCSNRSDAMMDVLSQREPHRSKLASHRLPILLPLSTLHFNTTSVTQPNQGGNTSAVPRLRQIISLPLYPTDLDAALLHHAPHQPTLPPKALSLCLQVQTNQPRPHPKVVPRRTHLSAFWPTSSVTHPRPSPFPPINAATSSPTRPQRLSSALNLPPLASFVAP
jgi:hypothetical protein